MKKLLTRKSKARIIHRELNILFPGNMVTPLKYTSEFELVVAVILSAQCTDNRVNLITKKLFSNYLSVHDYAKANREELQKIIFPAGFYRIKSAAIISCAKEILSKHGGQVPATMNDLLALPGIGRKSANVILGHLFGRIEGIAVDTHVKRLSLKYGLTYETTPEKIERDLCELLPHKDWWNFSYRLKAYGRRYSPARKKSDNNDPISIALAKEFLKVKSNEAS